MIRGVVPAGLVAATTPGLRERKRLQTWRTIRDAALRLAAERGIQAVTVDEISAAAEISKRTFFNYFDSKENALVDPDPEALDQISTILAGRPAGEPPLVGVRAALVALLPNYGAQLRVVAREAAKSPVLLQRYLATLDGVQRMVAAWVAERSGIDPATSAYPELVAAVVLTCLQVTLIRWDRDDGRDIIEYVDEIMGLLAAGLAAPGGRPAV